MSKKIIIANWKMNLGFKESINLAKKIKSSKEVFANKIVLCPSFGSLIEVGKVLVGGKTFLGAQNVAEAEKGNWTGEVSADFLKKSGCRYVLVGHSERRQKLGETNEQINAKISQLLSKKLIPILCVGETLKEKLANLTIKVISRQLVSALKNIKIDPKQEFLVAYEPIWSISDGIHPGKTPEIAEVEKVHKFIKQTLIKTVNNDIIEQNLQVVYGGSVTADNARVFLSSPEVDGVLVGGASLKSSEFIKIATIK